MSYPYVGPEPERDEYVLTADRGEFVCPICGYGIVARYEPPRCPMCGSERLDFAAWRPFTGRGARALRAAMP